MLPLVKLTQTLTQTQLDRILEAIPSGASNVQDIYPLAPLQEGILFQHLITQQGDPYLAPFLLGFSSRSGLDRFLKALHKVVQRHDVLRTAMVWKDVDEPLQVVLRRVSVPVEEVALDNSTSAPDAATQLMTRFDHRSFKLDLSKAPLLHTAIAFDQSQDRWLLLMLTHHLILDHTSMEIVVGELQALMTNPDVSLPAPIPYRNFIAQSRAATPREEQQAFFTKLLRDVDEPTAPWGLLDTQGESDTLESQLAIDPSLAQRIREQARALGVTPASLFHLAWAGVLGQICEKSDVVFGTVLLGRMRSGAGADRVVGMFINTLPIRLKIDRTSVTQSVAQTQQLLADLMAHEHAPLALAQRCSSVSAPAPLFSSLFNYRYSAPRGSEDHWPGVEMVNSSERTNYPLAMAVDDTGAGFLLTALAHPSADPEKACRYLQQALRSLVDLLERTPDSPIDSLQVLPRAERHTVVEEWNRTEARFEQGTLCSLFSAQARRTPNAVAVIGREGAELTYAELDAQSTHFARQLVANGVTTERVVGVRMERSAETIIALLGILKAGGVYLPLDPAYPPERLDYIANDSGASLVLTSIHDLVGEAELPVLNDPNRLAYVIYTSGTTGLPKGVAVPHSAPVNLAFARRACHDPISTGDRVLAAISVGFDVSIGQLLLPLLNGATVVVAGDLKAMSPAEFWAFLEQRRVTHINSVPSFFDSIIDAAPNADTLVLKRLMLGGEALTASLVKRIKKALPSTEVVNMYGPTEACIDATYHLSTDADLTAVVLPIGRPLSNYRAYVLDKRLEPVGVGLAGELYLGGAGIARGYVNKPDLTAERFVADPFSSTPGSRLYRTGDRARWREDGTIEFLGRVDDQVKIRGFRVEPGEIEAQLRNQPGVRDAVVAYYEFGATQVSIREASDVPSAAGGGARLIAYYTGDHAPALEQLRAELAAVLPDYMLPSAFVKLDQLPLSPNGKLDRKALPRDFVHDAAHAYEAPHNPTQTALQQIFQSVLGFHPIGINDNFFSLGGDSLAAMRLINTCNTQFKTNIPLRVLFEFPTIAELSAAIDGTSSASDAHQSLVRLRSGGSKRPLFCLHPAGGHVLGYAPLAAAVNADQPVYGIQTRALSEGVPLPTSFEEMATDYITAIRSVQPDGPYQLMGRSAGGLLAYEIAQQLNRAGEKVAFLALLDTFCPEPLEREFTEKEMLGLYAINNGLGRIFETKQLPASPADLLHRAQAAGLLQGLDLSQFQRLYAVWCNMVHLSNAYRPAPWSGPVVLFRAMRKSNPKKLQKDWARLLPPNFPVIDLDCEHDDFAEEWMAPTMAKHFERLLEDAAIATDR